MSFQQYKAFFGPDELATLSAAFDATWRELRLSGVDLSTEQKIISMQKKLASQDQLDQAQLKYEITVTAVHQAQQSLQLLREGPRQEEIARARAELEARRTAVQTAERQLGYTRLVTNLGSALPAG